MSENSVGQGMRPDVAQLLSEMRAIRGEIQDNLNLAGRGLDRPETELGSGPGAVDFSRLLVDAIDRVNAVQKESGQLANAYQQGDPEVTLAQVVIASEKAGVAFEAMTEIRNRLVNAYEDVMNMPI